MIRKILLIIGLALAIINVVQASASVNRCHHHIAEIKAHAEWLKYNGANNG